MFTFTQQKENAAKIKNNKDFLILKVDKKIRRPYTGFNEAFMLEDCISTLKSVIDDITETTIGLPVLFNSHSDRMNSHTRISIFEGLRIARMLGRECNVCEVTMTISVSVENLKEYYGNKKSFPQNDGLSG